MNVNMFNNKITQKNISYLKSLGYTFIYGNDGKLACGDYGAGRITEPEEVFKYISIK